MEAKLISLISANEIDNEGSSGTEIIINSAHITHFHKAEQKKGNFTHVHFLGGHSAFVKQSVEEIRNLIDPTKYTNYKRS